MRYPKYRYSRLTHIYMFVSAFFAGMAICLYPACPVSAQKGNPKMELKLTSTVFEQGQYIPRKYTGEGINISPPLQWSAPPEGTQSIALFCEDPDAPSGLWIHWVAWNIAPNKTGLPEGVPAEKASADGMKQGTNSFGKIGYGGPMPPAGSDHRYYFRVYAIDSQLSLQPGTTRSDLVKAMNHHVLAEGSLMGRYKR